MSRDNSRTACRNLLFSASRTERSLIGRHSGSASSCLCNFRSDAFESTVLVFDAVTGFIDTPHYSRQHVAEVSVRTSKNAKAIAAKQPARSMNQSLIARPKRPLDVIWFCRMKAAPTGVVDGEEI